MKILYPKQPTLKPCYVRGSTLVCVIVRFEKTSGNHHRAYFHECVVSHLQPLIILCVLMDRGKKYFAVFMLNSNLKFQPVVPDKFPAYLRVHCTLRFLAVQFAICNIFPQCKSTFWLSQNMSFWCYREAGPMLHALAFNPSEEQIAKLCENVRYL